MFSYIEVLKKYAVFSGRARRTELWMFMLMHMIIFMVLGFLDAFFSSAFEGIRGLLMNIYALALLIPPIAVGVRRLHDAGKSGWMMLLGLIPVIGFLILLVLWCIAGEHGRNQYGEDPKGFDGFQTDFA